MTQDNTYTDIKGNGNTIRYRVERLEEDLSGVSVRLDKIMENHLPHLREQISGLDSKITVLTALNVGAVVVGLLISRLFIN